ncbi:hypothetical protein JOE58_002036 [Curtobacterium luteum]|uniref:LysM domain-containing protein n=1 Tax=Curtobacterium luteum TaxID=33881 RepID=A0ABS2RUU0_9MICO|nr:LysM domain-containing protein [Curtobacterium luteum]MBM7802785.1 hypothetical protein [Curtobacterium luteum]NUU51251.1 LysM peptidoglycan-binding domain-containing protein [Curtobacterium luteum]
MGRRTRTIAVLGATAAAVLALSGCSLFGGDDAVPVPNRTAAAAPDGWTDGTAEPVPTPTPTSVLPVGTVAAETDVVSKSGDTSLHVRVVQRAEGVFAAELSDYRTTNPQPMSIEFRHRTAHWGDGDGGVVRGSVAWDTGAGPPDSYTLDAGPRPDYLASVVLVPVAGVDPSEGFATERPWIGSVLAVGALDWNIPNPYPHLRVTVGEAGPGAYGTVQDVDGTPTWYRVSHGDELITVSKRFGVTPEQFEWMNPYLELTDDRWLAENDVLNVSPANR